MALAARAFYVVHASSAPPGAETPARIEVGQAAAFPYQVMRDSPASFRRHTIEAEPLHACVWWCGDGPGSGGESGLQWNPGVEVQPGSQPVGSTHSRRPSEVKVPFGLTVTNIAGRLLAEFLSLPKASSVASVEPSPSESASAARVRSSTVPLNAAQVRGHGPPRLAGVDGQVASFASTLNCLPCRMTTGIRRTQTVVEKFIEGT